METNNNEIFKQLQDAGYKKVGNWYMHDEVSVNLFTKEVKSTNQDILFSTIIRNGLSFERVENIRKFIESNKN